MSEFDISNIPDYVFHDAVKEALGDCMLTGGHGSRPYNFRCPLCGDSKDHKFKKRGFVLHNKGSWQYMCHNACGTMSFITYLKENNPDIYRRVIFHGFEKRERREYKEIEKKPVIIGPSVFKENELIPITDNHPMAKKGMEWAVSRMIRKEVYTKWYVCLKGERFYDRNADGSIVYNENGMPKGNEYSNRIIIPYYKFGGKWNQFDARSLDPKAFVRYMNLKDSEREHYNLDWLDTSKPFFLLEGSINSTFIRNAVAFGGTKHFGSLLEERPDILANAKNGTVIWDNDSAGYDEMPKSIQLGLKWFNWSTIKPSFRHQFKEDGSLRIINDINDLVMYSDIADRDENEYIITECLNPFIESPDGGLIKTRLLYGDRTKLRKEKVKRNLEAMSASREARKRVVYNWE